MVVNVPGDPGGVGDISRGFSAAHPPVLDEINFSVPQGSQTTADFARSATPFGVEILINSLPGGIAALNPRLISLTPSGSILLVSIVICLVLSSLSWADSPLSSPASSLTQDLGPVRRFSLTSSEGNIFAPHQLRGKVWVAHFFYTTCTGGCTKTAPTMMELQKLFGTNKRDVAFVSISLNNDSAADLKRYARDLGADPQQWFFLTGPTSEVHAIVQKIFFQTALLSGSKEPGREIDHSFNLVVVDSRGEIRGYVDGSSPGTVPLLEDRIRELVRLKFLPARINAVLNTACAALLIAGYFSIRRRLERLHKACMLAALLVSLVFLANYLYYHFVVLAGQATPFSGSGWVRPVYFTILLSHTVLAAVVAPLALYVTYQGLRDSRRRHVRVARWTLPIWLYVSITGVVVYAMLYHLYPPI